MTSGRASWDFEADYKKKKHQNNEAFLGVHAGWSGTLYREAHCVM